LCGMLGLLIGTEESVLGPGDSIYFDSSLRHAYRGLAEETCTALMVCAHPGRNLAERRMDRLEDLHVVGRHSQPGNGKTLSSSPSSGAVAGRAKDILGNKLAPKMEPVGSPFGTKSQGAVARAALRPRATSPDGDQSTPRALLVTNSTLNAEKPTRRPDRARPLLHPSRSPAKRKAE